MKLNVKGFGIVMGTWTAIVVAWAFIMAFTGIGNTPYQLISEFYLGWLSLSIGGMILGIVLSFIDGLVCGLLFAWLYNKFVKA